jgi:hypothetical protein
MLLLKVKWKGRNASGFEQQQSKKVKERKELKKERKGMVSSVRRKAKSC